MYSMRVPTRLTTRLRRTVQPRRLGGGRDEVGNTSYHTHCIYYAVEIRIPDRSSETRK